ncbi:mite allergen Der p 3-like [Oppia nitens]|uniref:mite allergen Der p 3-like n=1 Tax=Oppia nitens TaxID=1686743 RepID=UPI0023DB27F7|nr:mite allergen Der p 3-like [Oppia nitens]
MYSIEILLTILCICIVSHLSIGKSIDFDDERVGIIGGHDARPGDNPHMCSMRINGNHYCGASIIGDSWAVTAAHCIVGLTPPYLSLHCGTTDRTKQGRDYNNVSRVIWHEHFDYKVDLVNDIGLIEIKGKFDMDNKYINKIALPVQGYDQPAGVNVTSVGWGYTEYNINITKHEFPQTLQTVDMPVVDRDVCLEVYQDFFKEIGQNYTIDVRTVCAGGHGGHNVCDHDSGSPLKFNNMLIGLTSWGKHCAIPGYPTVYTAVGQYRDWIKNHTGI